MRPARFESAQCQMGDGIAKSGFKIVLLKHKRLIVGRDRQLGAARLTQSVPEIAPGVGAQRIEIGRGPKALDRSAHRVPFGQEIAKIDMGLGRFRGSGDHRT